MKKKYDRIFRILGALSTAIIFSLFIWAAFGFYQLVSLRFFDPGYMSSYMGDWKIQPPFGLTVAIFILSAIIIFILFFKIEMGKPTGGKINISDVFDRPKELFKAIRDGQYSLKQVLLLIAIISFLSVCFGILNNHIYMQAKYGFLTNIMENYEGMTIAGDYELGKNFAIRLVPTSFSEFLPSSLNVFLIIVLAVIGGVVVSFTLPFLIYWLLRVSKEKIPYLNLYALSIYLSLILLAFLIVTTIVNVTFYYALGNVSTVNKEFLPYLGSFLFYVALAYGINDIGEISLKKSFVIISPFIVLIIFTIYLDYFFIYEMPNRILEIVCMQLGL